MIFRKKNSQFGTNLKHFVTTGVKIGIFAILSNHVSTTIAQTVPVGTYGLEDYYRRAQLKGDLDSAVSFTIRPISPFRINESRSAFYPEGRLQNDDLLNIQNSFKSSDGKLYTELLPVSIQLQINSHHPYGWNDGSMIPAKGLQTVVSAGIYGEYGPLSFQFRPELVSAENAEFSTFDTDHYPIIFARYYDFYNQIDAPARFGTKRYSKAFWGQSSVRLNHKGFSVGLSTENLWWGPGLKNSLVLSNTAPGFKHVTINTTHPITTAIGSFEGQIIAGQLKDSGFGPLEPNVEYFDSPLYQKKNPDWRLLTGMVLTWRPKWIPGLFLGISRSAQKYSKDVNNIGDALPFFSSVKSVQADDPINTRDQRSAMFLRWLWLAENAEFYFEMGKSNHVRSVRQSALQPDRGRAYLVGVRKIIDLETRNDDNLMVEVEAAQLQQTQVSDIMALRSWYIHPYIRQGYSHEGQLLGAGIGPGANMQSVNVSWLRGLKRIGIQAERLVHNNDFYFYAYTDSQDPRRHWVDISLAAAGEWDYKNIIFNAKLQGTKSINYQWYLFQEPTATTYWVNGRDAFNVQFQMGVSYRF